MATIKPFAALRPRPDLAEKICELPYDVMSSEEARELATGNSLSFLHVSKPEIDFPPGADIYAPQSYAKGRENFRRLIAAGALQRFDRVFSGVPLLYLADGHDHTGAAARVYQARNGAGTSGAFLAVILPHDQMQILAYHRVLKDLSGLTPARMLERLAGV